MRLTLGRSLPAALARPGGRRTREGRLSSDQAYFNQPSDQSLQLAAMAGGDQVAAPVVDKGARIDGRMVADIPERRRGQKSEGQPAH